MKKLFTLLFAAAALSASAQQPPNGSFENWSAATNPDSWGTLATGIPGAPPALNALAVKDTNAINRVDGAASLKLVTTTVNLGQTLTLPGIASLGSLSIGAGGISFQGIPYTKRVDTIYFSYRYLGARTVDSGVAEFNLSAAGVSLFGGSLGLTLDPSASMQNVVIPLFKNATTYYTNTTTLPDTMRMTFYSSTDTAATSDGSILWIDNIRFDAGVEVSTGIEEFNSPANGLKVYPNPVADLLQLAVEETEVGNVFQLFDLNGREVLSHSITHARFNISVQHLPAGAYNIRMNSRDGMTTYKGRILIQH